MKILVYGSREFKAGFMKAQSQCGHQVLFTDRLPSAEDAISFSPDPDGPEAGIPHTGLPGCAL